MTSTALRERYGNDPERYDEFARRYEAELEISQAAVLARLLRTR